MVEEMSAFFAARVEGYDEHMLREVVGCREGYARLAQALPEGVRELLDLGCGTGLELDALFARFPRLRVTGLDMTEEMLRALRRKHPDKALTLRCQDYRQADFGRERFDAAVSFESLHHLEPEEKRGIYARVFAALRPGGGFWNGDYVVDDLAEEERFRQEARRLRAAAGLSPETPLHLDTPLALETELDLLRQAGFRRVCCLFRQGGTALFCGERPAGA